MTRNKQIQVKVSLSPNLYEALQYKAKMLDVPITQLVKFFIIKEVQDTGFFVPPLDQIKSRPDKRMQDLFNKSHYLDSLK